VTRFMGSFPHMNAAEVGDLTRVDERAGADEMRVEVIDLLNTPVMDVAQGPHPLGQGRAASSLPACKPDIFSVLEAVVSSAIAACAFHASYRSWAASLFVGSLVRSTPTRLSAAAMWGDSLGHGVTRAKWVRWA
jgi:hypothetical protein